MGEEETVGGEVEEADSSNQDSDGHHHHHHHHYYHNIQHCGCDCGELSSLYLRKNGTYWLKHLFSTKDDVAWLKKLLAKGEITQYQYKWLKKLFEDKAHEDMEYAASWWQNVFTSKYTGFFDTATIPG